MCVCVCVNLCVHRKQAAPNRWCSRRPHTRNTFCSKSLAHSPLGYQLERLRCEVCLGCMTGRSRMPAVVTLTVHAGSGKFGAAEGAGQPGG